MPACAQKPNDKIWVSVFLKNVAAGINKLKNYHSKSIQNQKKN